MGTRSPKHRSAGQRLWMRLPVLPQQRGAEGPFRKSALHSLWATEVQRVAGLTALPLLQILPSHLLPSHPLCKCWVSEPHKQGMGEPVKRRRIRSCWLISIIITVITNNSDNRPPIYMEACSSEAPSHSLLSPSPTVGRGKWRQLSSFSLWKQETGAWGTQKNS